MTKQVTLDENPDACIRCAACQAVCPVARVRPHFPGPKQAGPGLQRFRSPDAPPNGDWIDFCIGCRLCETVCAAGVNISDLNLLAKAKHLDEKGRPLRDWILSHSHLFGRTGSLLNPLVNRVLGNAAFRRVLEACFGIDRRRNLPAYESPTFREWFKTHAFTSDKKIAFFYGCYVNTNEVDVGKATVQVLESQGIQVTLPPQTCCGVPMLGNGEFKQARKMGRANVSSLTRAVRSGLEIIFSSTSCGRMIKHDYSSVLNIPGADEVAQHTRDVFEFLREARENLKGRLKPIHRKLAYFAPCHLRSLGIGFPAYEILREVPGVHIDFIEADCCGLGGTFGFKKEKYDVSQEIGTDLAQAIARLDPEIVLSDCEGCRMQIRHLTGLDVLHPIQILRDALIP
jgi:glycerol-3-phosphate dehydrogenase subunit C